VFFHVIFLVMFAGRVRSLFSAVFFAFLLTATQGLAQDQGAVTKQLRAVQSACEKKFDPKTDHFPSQAKLRYAKRFSVSYHGYYKHVTVNQPWVGSKEKFEYLLLSCGAPRPKGYPGATVIDIPVKNIAALSTTQISLIEMLGEGDKINGVSDIRWVYSEGLRKRYRLQKISELGFETGLDLERILMLNPDLVFINGIDESIIKAVNEIRQSKSTAVVFAEYMEEEPLGRTEWVKFVSLFLNLESKAESRFSKVEKPYLELKKKVLKTKRKPSVFTGVEHQGTWYLPGMKSFISNLIKDAGASYVFRENNYPGARNYDFEWVYDKAGQADFWINTDQWKTMADVLRADERYALFKAFKTRRIYNNNLRLNRFGGNDYWEGALVKPHLVLEDLVGIFHPDLVPEGTLNWYHRLQ